MNDLLKELTSQGLLKEEDIVSLQEESERTGESVESLLGKRGIDVAQILKLKGQQFGIPTRSVEGAIPTEILSYIPEDSARHYHFAPLGVKDSVLEVGVTDPDNLDAIDALNFISSKINLPFKIFLISEADLTKVLGMYKGLSTEVDDALSDFETAGVGGALKTEISSEVDDELGSTSDMVNDKKGGQII